MEMTLDREASKQAEAAECSVLSQLPDLPGGTVGYPAHPRLIRCPSVCNFTFKFSAENRPGPTDLVKHCLKIVNCRELTINL